jgi:hypothetical protein
MRLRDAINQLEQFAQQMGDDAEFGIYDRDNDVRYEVDPDYDVFEFEILRGDNEVVIEFD